LGIVFEIIKSELTNIAPCKIKPKLKFLQLKPERNFTTLSKSG